MNSDPSAASRLSSLQELRERGPLEAVVQRSGSQVFVNIPKLVAGKMPWHEPPTAQGHREKMGPGESSAAPLYGSTGPTGAV